MWCALVPLTSWIPAGNYLSFNVDKLAELPRQPGGGFNAQAQDLAGSQSGLTQFGIDPTGPTGGSFLAAIIDSPTISERWHQGGYVGYAITAVGAFAFAGYLPAGCADCSGWQGVLAAQVELCQ